MSTSQVHAQKPAAQAKATPAAAAIPKGESWVIGDSHLIVGAERLTIVGGYRYSILRDGSTRSSVDDPRACQSQDAVTHWGERGVFALGSASLPLAAVERLRLVEQMGAALRVVPVAVQMAWAALTRQAGKPGSVERPQPAARVEEQLIPELLLEFYHKRLQL